MQSVLLVEFKTIENYQKIKAPDTAKPCDIRGFLGADEGI